MPPLSFVPLLEKRDEGKRCLQYRVSVFPYEQREVTRRLFRCASFRLASVLILFTTSTGAGRGGEIDFNFLARDE